MKKKIEKKCFFFIDDWILIRCFKYSLSRREDLPSALNLLGNSF